MHHFSVRVSNSVTLFYSKELVGPFRGPQVGKLIPPLPFSRFYYFQPWFSPLYREDDKTLFLFLMLVLVLIVYQSSWPGIFLGIKKVSLYFNANVLEL